MIVRGDQLTGELVSLEGIGGTEFTYPTAVVQVQAGNITIPIVAAVVDIGHNIDGGLLGNDIEHETFIALLKLAHDKKLHADNVVHVKMTRAQRLLEQQEAETTAKQEKADQASPKPVADTLTALAIEESGEESGSVGLDDDSVGLADSLATSSEAVELRAGEEEELTGEGTDRVAISLDDVCVNETLFSDPADTALVGLESPFPVSSETDSRRRRLQMIPSKSGEQQPQPEQEDSPGMDPSSVRTRTARTVTLAPSLQCHRS